MLREDHHYRAAPGLEAEGSTWAQISTSSTYISTYRLCCLGGVIGLALIGVLISVILCRTKLLGAMG